MFHFKYIFACLDDANSIFPQQPCAHQGRHNELKSGSYKVNRMCDCFLIQQDSCFSLNADASMKYFTYTRYKN